MKKQVNYKGKEYSIEIKWSGSSYCVRAVGVGCFKSIPSDCLGDIEKIKPYIVESIENNHDLKTIELWDGNIDKSDIVKQDCEHKFKDLVFFKNSNGVKCSCGSEWHF